MSIRRFPCIQCPMGCALEVELDETGAVTKVSGFTCKNGREYAVNECTDPRRTVSSLVRCAGGHIPVSVRTRTSVPKRLIRPVLEQIRQTEAPKGTRLGDVLIHDVAGTGVDVVATRDDWNE